jgi:tRNA G18 (ribose-2'-O)-methylase SpoU
MNAYDPALTRPYSIREIPGTHEGWFVIEGIRNVEAVIERGLKLESVLIVGDALKDSLPEIPAGVPVLRPDKAAALEIFGAEFHHGIAAVARAPQKIRITEALPGFFSPGSPARTIVVCPCLGDASNLGAIIRNAAALGADAVVCSDRGVSPWSRKAVRASSGTMFKIPVIVSPDLYGDLAEFTELADTTLAATRLAADAIPLPDWKPAGRHVALMMGGEAHGLEAQWLEFPHDAVIIPMAAGVDSMNVAASSAVVMYHLTQGAGRRS